MGINWSEFTGSLVNFLIIYIILKKVLFDKVNKILDERQKKTEESIEKTKDRLKEAEEIKLKNQEELKNIKSEGKKIVEANKKKANDLYDEIINEAHKEASLIIERANTEIARDKKKAEDEVKTKAIDIAVMLSEKAMQETIDEKKHREIIDDFISKVGI